MSVCKQTPRENVQLVNRPSETQPTSASSLGTYWEGYKTRHSSAQHPLTTPRAPHKSNERSPWTRLTVHLVDLYLTVCNTEGLSTI